MRTAVSRWMLAHLEQNTPEWVRCLEIRILLNLASRSFRSKKIRVGRRSASEALQAYAVYTAACMSETEADPRRLYESAFQLGKRLRRLTGLTGQQDVQRLIFYLYRNIQITMQGALPGEITVPACYFSEFYSPGQCRLMSNVDAGIIAGLSGGGSLRFTDRLTEGCGQCRAVFTREEQDE